MSPVAPETSAATTATRRHSSHTSNTRILVRVALVLLAVVAVMWVAGRLPAPGTGPFAPQPVHHGQWVQESAWIP